MKNIINTWSSWSPKILSVVRIIAAFMFILNGTSKLFNFPVPFMPNGPAIQLFSQMGLAGVLETFGGLLLLFGFLSRPVAFILFLEMTIAYFQAHAGNSIWPTANRGERAILYGLVWLYISSAGPGAWSIDAIMKKKKLDSQIV